MNIIITLLTVAILTAILNILIIQSNNFIFLFFKRPVAWIFFMFFLSLLYFFIGSQFENSFNIIWWSAFLSFIINIPPKAKKEDGMNQDKKNKLVDEVYENMGIKKGRLKYRLGLASYVIGGILGWVIFYGEIVSIVD